MPCDIRSRFIAHCWHQWFFVRKRENILDSKCSRYRQFNVFTNWKRLNTFVLNWKFMYRRRYRRFSSRMGERKWRQRDGCCALEVRQNLKNVDVENNSNFLELIATLLVGILDLSKYITKILTSVREVLEETSLLASWCGSVPTL